MTRDQGRDEDVAQPPRPGSWEAVYWGAISRLLRAVAPLSEGLSLGYRQGFDSGPMLDYVYRNRASGRLGIGRVLDRVHLNAIGWRAIRQRKAHLQMLLRETIGRQRAQGQAVHIVDIASGPGRYLLELLEELSPSEMRVTLRDRDPIGLAQGRALAQGMGLASARYEPGDAFDPQDLARISPRPTIAVVSGLYELFADNALIARSLAGLAHVLQPGGALLYTNQPTHPQLKFIARCLPNREGRPWTMRLRPQAEMDRLVRDAGLRPERTVVDRWGIFTVTVARKPAGPPAAHAARHAMG